MISYMSKNYMSNNVGAGLMILWIRIIDFSISMDPEKF